MKKIKTLAIALLSASTFAFAQVQLPQPSPKASVTQTAGLTDITIDYSSPAVKSRTIWGELVPFDKVWRAGANAATKITFSKDVTINGTAVAKGTYSVFAIPSKAEWTIIINKDANASESQYKQENDIVRIKAAPSVIPHRERLAYSISDFNDDKATVSLEWEKVKVSFDIVLATAKQADENVDRSLGEIWRTYNNTARYYYDQKNYDKALTYINQSIAASNQWFNNWVKAQILAAKGDTKSAYEHALKAKGLGDENPQGFFFKDQVEKALAEWKPATDSKKKK